MVGNTLWNLGGISSYNNVLASQFYSYERGTDVYSGNPTTWIGKIGLMYSSDYGYATSGGATINRSLCLAKELSNWHDSGYSDCKNNSYLYDSSDSQWTLTSYSYIYYEVFYLNFTGSITNYNTGENSAVYPVLYLNSNVLITSGHGTQNNPYRLNLS